jgi:hypothetical protein
VRLVEEPGFNPLKDGDSESEMKYKLENVSDDDSLEGHNTEWMESSKKFHRGETNPTYLTSIDVTQPLPQLLYKDIPILFQDPQEAKNLNRYFAVKLCFKLCSKPMLGKNGTAIGFTLGIEGLEVWKSGDYGCGVCSALDHCPH